MTRRDEAPSREAPPYARDREQHRGAPRVWAERQTGWRPRAIAAQQNQFKAFPPFAAAVLAAELARAPQARIDALAVAFVAARVAYTAAYVSDRATMRSAVWAVGFACVLWLFVLPV